jgi:hypothetical protein
MKKEYWTLKPITMIDFEVARRGEMIIDEGVPQFCRFSGLRIHGNGNVDAVQNNPFVKQVLWSVCCNAGVTTCSNHLKGRHGQANRKTLGQLTRRRRIAAITRLITSNMEMFLVDQLNGSAKKTLKGLIE